MRILQIIDSLEPGGAERMAVNYANSLAQKFEYSALATTRAEGMLKSKIDSDVKYIFLNRKSTIDFKAAKRLAKFCTDNKIDFIHAHSSSYFIALMTKLFGVKVKIIWHDHNGMSEYLEKRSTLALKFASRFFTGIISVNQLLMQWAIEKLKCKNVIYLPNFAIPDEKSSSAQMKLSGDEGKRILCLANLRPQKNHYLLLEAAQKIREKFSDWTFHLVGKDFKDEYSANLQREIERMNLEQTVFVYGSTNDSASVIRQADICVISSLSEGLPVALLEYGFESKAVVCTNVGEIPSIIRSNENGFIVPSQDDDAFVFSVEKLIENQLLREKLGKNLLETVKSQYSPEVVLHQYLNWVKKL